jgi:hypothetical protein
MEYAEFSGKAMSTIRSLCDWMPTKSLGGSREPIPR